MGTEPRLTPRTCPECGEKSPARFDLCWSCGADLPSPTKRAERTTDAAGVGDTRPQDAEPLPSANSASPAFSKSFEWLELGGILLLTQGSLLLWHFLLPNRESSSRSEWFAWIPDYLGLS